MERATRMSVTCGRLPASSRVRYLWCLKDHVPQMQDLDLEMESMKAQEKPVKRRHPPVIFASLVQNVMKMLRMSGVCATLIVLKPTSTPSVLLMGNHMIMHVKSKKHHVRNRRKLKSCHWADVKITQLRLQNLKMGITQEQIMQRMLTNWKKAPENTTYLVRNIIMASACMGSANILSICRSRLAGVMLVILDNTVKKRTTVYSMLFLVPYDFNTS